MSTRRTARVASMIREVVSSAILTELRDPRIRNVTVLGADVSPDLRHAAIKISVLGDEKVAALTLHGLNSARGFLQSKVATYIKSRYTPELRFVLDDALGRAAATSAILKELNAETGTTDDGTVEHTESDKDCDNTIITDEITAELNSDDDTDDDN